MERHVANKMNSYTDAVAVEGEVQIMPIMNIENRRIPRERKTGILTE